jgi:hypothetical protein
MGAHNQNRVRARQFPSFPANVWKKARTGMSCKIMFGAPCETKRLGWGFIALSQVYDVQF